MPLLSSGRDGSREPSCRTGLSQPMTNTPDLQQDASEFLTARDLARFLGVALVSVYRLVERRTLPVYRILHKLLFRRADVLAWIESTRTAPWTSSVCR